MRTLWKASINVPLKRLLFVVTVEIILLYGSEPLTVQQQKSLNGTYTRIPRKAILYLGKNTWKTNDIWTFASSFY